MPGQKLLSRFVIKFLENTFSLEENSGRDIGSPKEILVVRQHNQFGDLLASVSLFRAIKEKYPNAKLSVILSPDNYYAITKNKFIDEYIVFNKSKLFNLFYFIKLKRFLRKSYDVAVVPATVSISLTSCILARISDAKIRIGPASLDGKENKYAFLLDRRVVLDWRKCPDAHISDFGLDIIRPFGITTKNFRASIHYDNSDIITAERFLSELTAEKNNLVIGLHVGAGKPPNRWSLNKFAKIITLLNKEYDAKCYVTGSSTDKNELDFIEEHLDIKIMFFINRTIPELAALISKSDLFITNDTGVMHVAGATDTPQISIFGPTNPFNWAPVGANKFFIRKSELIDDISVEDVFKLCNMILSKKNI